MHASQSLLELLAHRARGSTYFVVSGLLKRAFQPARRRVGLRNGDQQKLRPLFVRFHRWRAERHPSASARIDSRTARHTGLRMCGSNPRTLSVSVA
jgi:hypothetical protein